MQFTPVHRTSPSRLHSLCAIAMSFAFAVALCGIALAQEIQVSGRVTSLQGDPLHGVSVRVQGTDIRTTTGADGRYSLTAPADGVLLLTSLGYRPVGLSIARRTILDVVMEPAIAVLDAVVVTGYTEQRRADITGAVTSIDMPSVKRQTTASVLKRLDGRIPGVTVDASGSPGSRSTVRIRGISSFQNNDPLYIIDGTPVEDTYLNWLNPYDIESIQVLKDASAASIYGSRASNGVVVIQTVRGRVGPPRFTMDVRMGMATPVRGYDDFLILDALEYHEIVKRSYENAGQPVPENIYGDPDNPTIPAYIWPNDGVNQTTTVDSGAYSWPDNLIMPGSRGTNWWDVVFGPALVANANLGVSGGSVAHRYGVSFNYLNQEGTAAYNRYQRGSVRINTEFDVGKLTIGENVSFSLAQAVGGLDDWRLACCTRSFMGRWGSNLLMQPVIPVHDIGGNFASGKAVGLGNQSNPLKGAWADKDDAIQDMRIFGNLFAGFDVLAGVQVMSRFGFNLGEQSFVGYTPIYPEDPEPVMFDRLDESYASFRDWTWSNTLTFSHTLGERHSLQILLGQEASKHSDRSSNANIDNLITSDVDARYIQDPIGDPETKNVNTIGSRTALLSFFGRVDYNFAERYHLSLTLRRDGSSTFGPANRWGTFPAFSVGWRLSQEPFLQANEFFTNIMLRFGWGVTGNQNVPTGRTIAQFGGSTGTTYYDIGGNNTSIVPGFMQTAMGNPNLKWEENESMNLGLDLEFFGGVASLVVDAYQRDTDNLFFDPRVPGTAGAAAPPIVNIGHVRNRGIDFSLGYAGTIGGANWRVTFNGSHYKNEILRIVEESGYFLGTTVRWMEHIGINQVGHPIGAFYGMIADGFFESQDAANGYLPSDPDDPESECTVACQDGAAPGRIRFVDVNGDGRVNSDDRTIIGDPHPDFTAGLDLELEWGAFDFNATLFGTFGNDIFEVQKFWYVFRSMASNVRRDLLTDSWTPDNLDAKYPRLDANDRFSWTPSSYYVEDGSYVRLRNLQLGYRIPQSWIPGMRLYVQAENLFTITGYPGLDPALPAQSSFGPAGDIRDQSRGIDQGTYPSNRTFGLGISAMF